MKILYLCFALALYSCVEKKGETVEKQPDKAVIVNVSSSMLIPDNRFLLIFDLAAPDTTMAATAEDCTCHILRIDTTSYMRGSYHALLYHVVVKNDASRNYVVWMSVPVIDGHFEEDYIINHETEARLNEYSIRTLLSFIDKIEGPIEADEYTFMKRLCPGEAFECVWVKDYGDNPRSVVVAVPEEEVVRSLRCPIPEKLLFKGDRFFFCSDIGIDEIDKERQRERMKRAQRCVILRD